MVQDIDNVVQIVQIHLLKKIKGKKKEKKKGKKKVHKDKKSDGTIFMAIGRFKHKETHVGLDNQFDEFDILPIGQHNLIVPTSFVL